MENKISYFYKFDFFILLFFDKIKRDFLAIFYDKKYHEIRGGKPYERGEKKLISK